MDNQQRFAHIPGWGADLDPADRPAYPKERTPARLPGLHWQEPVQQERSVEVLCSTERDSRITPVFGSTVPPSGLSGVMRRLAFRYSENDLRHWMILLAADRANVVEGVADDLLHGHIPNVLGEMGIGAAWKHDRAGVLRKAALGVAITGAILLLRRHRARR
ncbi:hypothetical protein GN316_14515 [Xylophilus sp. Kf1]|nr:hypothetical protein [Xylophilus sp. Kf1]